MGSIYQVAPDPWMGMFCSRCGQHVLDCPHPFQLRRLMHPEHAVRIRARYELGKAFNPDHDTTDYFTEAA